MRNCSAFAQLFAVACLVALLTSACGFELPSLNGPATGAVTANPAHQIEVVSVTQWGNSVSVRIRNPNSDVGLIRSPFELAMIDQSGAVIGTAGQHGLPGAPANTIYQLPPGGEYGFNSLSVPDGMTLATVEVTILGPWYQWETVNAPSVTVTDVTVLPDGGPFGPTVTGRVTLDGEGPANVVVLAFVETSAGFVVSDILVECAQAGQRRTFEARSTADAEGPYRVDRVVAYATAVKGAGPQFDPRCGSDPAGESAPPPTGSSAPSAQTSPSVRFPSTDEVRVDRAGSAGHLVAVRLARNEGFDRLVFEFADSVPSFEVDYRPLPAYMDGSGREIPLPGASSFAQVTMTGATGDGWGGGAKTYFGPPTVTADTVVVTEAKEAGDFEAVLTWVVGVRRETRFSVLEFAAPPRLVVDFVH